MPRPFPSNFLSTTVLALLLIPGTAFACPQNDTNCYLYSAEQAIRDLDESGFFDALAGAQRAQALSPAPTASERAAVLRLEGIGDAWRGEDSAALAAFREARRLDPSAGLPADLYGPDHPIARLYAEAAPGVPAPLLVAAPAPTDPPITVLRVDLPPSPAERSRPLLLGAVASGLVSGGLFALAQGVDDVEVSAPSDPEAFVQAQAAATSRRMALQAGSGGAALVGAGLLTAGLTVRW